jgi:DNA-binding NtrC family response regulator
MERRQSVLVVEDQANEREALLRFLRSEGYLAFGAATASDAFDYYDDAALVLSDVRMGAVNGLQLLKMWKQRQPSTPFILMTAFAEIDAAVEAVKAGAEDYLVKPINPTELLAKISQCLDRAADASEAVSKNGASRPSAAEAHSNGQRDMGAIVAPGVPLEEIERSAIQRTLASYGGNRTRTAQALGISVRTLQRKLKAWNPIGLPQPAEASHSV